MVNHALAVSFGLAGCAGLVARSGATEAFRQLKGPEITARFTGMEFMDGIHWGLVFRKGGRVTAVEAGGRITAVEREPKFGRWHVGKDELALGSADKTSAAIRSGSRARSSNSAELATLRRTASCKSRRLAGEQATMT